MRYTSGTTPTTFKYTGQREESSFGLYYYGARWYDPALGRFTQADSIVPGGVQGLDRYAYANNNPLRYTDPSGHGVFDTVSQFIAGFSAEFLVRNNIPGNILVPEVAESLTVSSSESTSMLVGRVAADVVTIGLGVAEVTAGMGVTGGGAVVSCGSTACIGAVATTAAGVAVVAYGATTALAGAKGLGGNLSLITKQGENGNSSSPQYSSSESLLDHYNKHGPEMGYQNPNDYLNDAQKIAQGGKNILSYTRGNGDTMYYYVTENKFVVVTKDNTIRTFFQPDDGIYYWWDQISK